MNRSLTNVLFGGIGTAVNAEPHKIEGTTTKTTVDDTVEALSNAENVILVYITSLPFCTGLIDFRLSVMEWLLQRRSMPYQKSVPYCDQEV